MVKVPTHLEVKIYERKHWYQGLDSDALIPLANEVPARYVNCNLRKTEKMFLVDPKRPAAGVGAYGFTFMSGVKPGDNQEDAIKAAHTDSAGHGYLMGVAYRSDDKTLEQSATLVNSLEGLSKLSN